MALQIINGPTIAAGQSLSDVLDCAGGTLVRITVPTEWSNAPLSFQVSTDNVYFNDLFLADGREVVVDCAAGRGIMLNPEMSASIAFIKFRSGTRDHPVVQTAERFFGVAVRTASAWRPNLVDIPGLKFWFDPTDPSKMSIDPLGGIDLFIPRVGDPGLYTLSQPVEVNRPTTVPSPNGKTVAAFNGNRWLRKDGAPFNLTGGLTMILAWGDAAPDTVQGYVSLHSGAICRLYLLTTTGPPRVQYRYGESPDQGFDYRPIVGNEWNISTMRARESWLNGADLQTLPGGSYITNPAQQMNYGMVVSSPPMLGVLGHWLLIEGPVSDDMLRKLEGFIAWDLGFEGRLAAGHPWKDKAP
jgi:hypothetical protein